IDGNFLVDMAVRAAEAQLWDTSGPRKQILPFFAGLNKTMYYTLCDLAEQVGLGHKEPKRFLTNPDYWGKFSEGAVDIKIKPGSNIPKIQKALFKVCHRLIREHCDELHPDKARYVDLLAYFMFNFWN